MPNLEFHFQKEMQNKRIAFAFLLFLCFLSAHARYEFDVDPLPLLTDTQTQGFMIGIPVAVIVLGCLFLLCGHRTHQSTLFTLGGLLFGGVAYLVQADQATETTSYIPIVIAIVMGIVGGILFIFSTFLIVFCIGALPALLIGAILLSTPLSRMISDPLAQFLWCFTFVFTGGTIALIFQKTLLVFGTALLGSFMIISGVDALWLGVSFVHVLPNLVAGFINGQVFYVPAGIQNTFWVLFAAMVAGFILGLLVQFKLTSASTDTPTIKMPAALPKKGG